jgi:hypothetical protein
MKILLLIVVLASTAMAGLVFKYRCGTCGLYENYAFPGSYKCPSDNGIMVPVGNDPFKGCD